MIYFYEDHGDGWHTVRLVYYKQAMENGKRVGEKQEISYQEWAANQGNNIANAMYKSSL